MKTSLLSLAFLFCLAVSANAQIFNFPPPFPFPQVTWTDGILSGDSLTVFLASDPSEPETRKLWCVRLAALQAPQSTGGGLTEALSANATLALASLTSAQRLYVQVVNVDQSGKRESPRLIVTVFIPSQSKPWNKWQDVGEIMIRNGLVTVRCGYRNELPEEIAARYAAAEQEAKANRRGLWRWLSALVYEDCQQAAPPRKDAPARPIAPKR